MAVEGISEAMAETVKPTHTASSDSSSLCGIASSSVNRACGSLGKRAARASRTSRMPTAAGASSTSGAYCASLSCADAVMLMGVPP